jgi:hypothetical protein
MGHDDSEAVLRSFFVLGITMDTPTLVTLVLTLIGSGSQSSLDARLTDMERNPDDQSSWPEVKARLERLSR